MRFWLILALILVLMIAVTWLTPQFQQGDDLVRIQALGWVVEARFSIILAAVLIGFLLLYSLSRLLEAPRRAAERVARSGLERGLLALAEGDWSRAERTLIRAARHLDSPAGYLAAARSVQGADAAQRREKYLAAADDGGRRTQLLIGLTRARLLMGEERWREAADLLAGLHTDHPRHEQVLRMLLACYRSLGDWRSAQIILPDLQRKKVTDPKQAAHITALALEQVSEAEDVNVERFWQTIPKALRQREEVLIAFAAGSRRRAHPEWALGVITKALKRQWSAALVTAYGEVAEADPKQALAQCERWRKQHTQDAALEQVMGRLCRIQGLWGKAREHYERSLELEPSALGYRALGDFLTERGENDQALVCYRNALRLEQGQVPQALRDAVPRPAQLDSAKIKSLDAPRDYA